MENATLQPLSATCRGGHVEAVFLSEDTLQKKMILILVFPSQKNAFVHITIKPSTSIATKGVPFQSINMSREGACLLKGLQWVYAY